MTTNNRPLTPYDVERRLIALSAKLEQATNHLIEMEELYSAENSAYELACARNRLALAGGAEKLTVQEKEARTLIECEEERIRRDYADAQLKAAKAVLKQIYTDIDVWRSVGSSVRAAVDIS